MIEATYKPNYNDGNWHGWNGGECPVHPETVVQAIAANGNATLNEFSPSLIERTAMTIDWEKDDGHLHAPVVAFRVVKEYREPREWWVNEYTHGMGEPRKTKEETDRASAGRIRCIHVREVLE